jgi:mono/diheme cytochrome c family protein
MTTIKLSLGFVLLLLMSPLSQAADSPEFNLVKAESARLPRPETVKISHDPVYKSAKEYEAYPLSEILNKIPMPPSSKPDQLVVVFTAADGYNVSMAYQDAMAEKGFIAFRDNAAPESKKWLEFKFGKQTITPAPFYLVWPKEGLDEWRYPWPFQLVSLSLQPAKTYFGAAAPTKTDDRINKGFELFSRYCIRCHSVNLAGGNVGPELNVPRNITEYFQEQALPKFIRNASAYRAGTKMPTFENLITPDDAQDIVHYLKQMKLEKAQ